MRTLTIVLASILLVGQIALAEDATVQLAEGTQLSAPGSSTLGIETATGGAKVVQDITVPAFKDTLTFTAPVVKAIRDRLSANPAATNTLLLRDANKKVLSRFTIDTGTATAAAVVVNPAVAPPTRIVPLATRSDCSAAASDWKRRNSEEWNGGKDALLVLFNRDAKGCYESTQYPRQGDTVYVGVVASDDDVIESASVQFSQCSREPVEPNIYAPEKPGDFITQAGGFQVQIVEVRRCWDKEITLSANVKQSGQSARESSRAVSFFERFRGTLQFGALYTDLHKRDFGLRDQAGQNIIYNKESVNKGPEYVASLIVYGFPNYFTGDGWKKGYRGRDILNDNSAADRTGLVILAGLEDASDRFGLGLSFDLAYGINLFVAHQWYRQKKLIGLAEGDVFAGAAEAITTKKEWETDTSIGMSFDVRYIKALFKGQ